MALKSAIPDSGDRSSITKVSVHISVMHEHMYLCTLCDFITTSKVQLPDHVQACHMSVMHSLQNVMSRYGCQVCSS